MKDLLKLAPVLFGWPWSKVGYLLALGLLYRSLISFDQAVLLIGLAVLIDPPRALAQGAPALSRTTVRLTTDTPRTRDKKT